MTKKTQTKTSNSKWKTFIGPGLFVGAVVGSIIYLLIDKNRPHNYLCEIVGADKDSNMIAMKCMYR